MFQIEDHPESMVSVINSTLARMMHGQIPKAFE